MIAIIRRQKLNFNKAMAKDNIRQASDANGLAAIHFAVYWPWALRRLIEAGADVNCEDSLGRRPIHIATACGQAEAVRLLLDANCALNPPNWSLSLLHESLRLGRDFDSVTSCIIDALIDRHTRLAKLASSVLPEYRKLEQLGQNCINEMDAPKLFDAMAGSEYSVDPALAADRHGLGVYDTADLHADIRLTPTLADQLWDGGFRRVDVFSPVNNLTPLLQSWYAADFDMVSWFIGKGVSPFAKSPLSSHSGLHLFAARMAFPGAHFNGDRNNIPSHQRLVKQLTSGTNMWHDSCRCLCSPGGCTPISIAVKQYGHGKQRNHETMLGLLRTLHERLLYHPEEDAGHVEQLLRILVFEKLNLRHTCCRIGTLGHTEPRRMRCDFKRRDYSGLEEEYQQCLAESSSKMLHCGCDILERPVCAVYRPKCENTRIVYRRKCKKTRIVYRPVREKRHAGSHQKLEKRRTVYH